MDLQSLSNVISPILTQVVNSVFPDKTKAAQINVDLQKALTEQLRIAEENGTLQFQAKADVIKTEMSQPGFANQWRAWIMGGLAVVVINYFVISPFLNALLSFVGIQIPIMPIPTEVWVLINVGLGGYLTKETISNYSQNRYVQFDYEAFYNVLRKKQGRLTQGDVDNYSEAIKAGLGK